MTLAIVTAWLNHPELEPEYFAAIEAGKPDQLVIVDDFSDEPLPYAALRMDGRTGFCGANNAGLALVETDHVLFLNNDIAALRETWLDEIRAQIEAGCVLGPLRKDPHGNVDDIPYPYVDGWCMGMVTSEARDMGGWDVRYDEAGPSYFSDNAFSFHARTHGMTLKNLRPGLMHKGGQTGGAGPAFEQALAINGPRFQVQVRGDQAHQDALIARR